MVKSEVHPLQAKNFRMIQHEILAVMWSIKRTCHIYIVLKIGEYLSRSRSADFRTLSIFLEIKAILKCAKHEAT